ncbi:MAG: MerR family transcriptional regulator [Acidobacteria bacterium]|nr:MerR family transcriptional regulator [Acidobacteriota bacterium]MCZ6746315.1 MerR family transcriptional regulator [Acidobacteriota bacterium]MCZ6832264.1 MerR family transcriptional regulator [Acidobacteriota bacterium]
MSTRQRDRTAGVRISIVASRYRIHPQTLRTWEREGLLTPSRSPGNTRLYGHGDLERLELILHLTKDLGVNLAGVEVILHMRERLENSRHEARELASALKESLAGRVPAGDEALAPLTHGSLIRSLKRIARNR